MFLVTINDTKSVLFNQFSLTFVQNVNFLLLKISFPYFSLTLENSFFPWPVATLLMWFHD